MKRLISLILTVVMLTSMLVMGMTTNAALLPTEETFEDALVLLDYFYARKGDNMRGYGSWFMNDLSNRFSAATDHKAGTNSYSVKGSDLEKLNSTYYGFDNIRASLEKYITTSDCTYDAATDTYTFPYWGGFGGFTRARNFAGFKKNGNTYDVYYGEVIYAYLSDVMENVDEYAESLDWPMEIEYNGIVYENSMDGYVAKLGLMDEGIKYTVEFVQADYNFDITYDSWYIYLSEKLPAGVTVKEYAESLGNPQYIEYEGDKYQYDDYYEDYVCSVEGDYVTKTANMSCKDTVVRILSYCDYTAEDLPASFDKFDSADIFVDLKVNDWSKDGIDYVVSHGYMNGTGNGTTFDQTGTMTRAMIVSVLYRIAGSPAPEGGNPFTDLQADQTWYHNAVVWAYENGIVTGTGATTFSPTGAVTREQMATFISRFAAYMGYDVETENDISSFPDFSSVNSWAVKGLAWANDNGIITGAVSGGVTIIAPQGEATREQVATILMRFCEKFN